MSRTIGLIVLYIGVIFDILGCIGLIRLPDLYNRLQAATKCVTLGTCMILLGSLIMAPTVSGVIQSGLCILFLLISSPTAADALAHGAYKAGVKLWRKSVVDHYAEDQESHTP